MDLLGILAAQLTDPFRIGLLVALLFTTRNTQAHTGLVLPILLGIGFVALIIPTTFPENASSWWMLVGVGLISNTIIVALLLALWLIWQRHFAGAAKR